MKTIKNLILVLTLTATFAVADDGHTSGGDRCATCPPPPCTTNCGGFAAEEPGIVETGTEVQNDETSMIEYWSKMFFDVIG